MQAVSGDKRSGGRRAGIRTVLLLAGLARLLALLILLLAFGDHPFLMADDKMYYVCVAAYRETARSLFDARALWSAAAAGGNYAPGLWFWVVSVLTALFRTTAAVRVFNLLGSVLCVKLTYSLARRYTDERTALAAAKLYSFLPYTVIPACSMLKDVWTTLVFLWGVRLIVDLFDRARPGRILQLLAAGTAAYFLREELAVVLLVLLAGKAYQKGCRTWRTRALLCVGVLVLVLILHARILEAAEHMLAYYFSFLRNDSTIRFVRIDSPLELYKLPVTVLFALLQPLPTLTGLYPAANAMAVLNFSLVPAAAANYLYLFRKKYDGLVYWTVAAAYGVAILLLLGSYRHYFFAFPFLAVSGAMEMAQDRKRNYLFLSIPIWIAELIYLLL